MGSKTNWSGNASGDGGGVSDAFTTVDVPNGTDPVASGSDTLVFTSNNSRVTMTGTAASDTVDFSSVIIDFGDGSDGDVTISVNTTLSRDMYYDNLTVNAGVTLTSGGFRIFAKSSATINGIIESNGSNGSGSSGGGAGNTATAPAGGAGGSGSSSAGSDGSLLSGGFDMGGNGGNGGDSSASGGDGAQTVAWVNMGGEHVLKHWIQSFEMAGVGYYHHSYIMGSGGGGGGGGGDFSNTGGGGGAGGGTVALYSPSITGSGNLNANGGDGADGVAGHAAGGGGGGGGVIVTVSINDFTATSITTSVVGGTGGSGSGSGQNGVNGTAGRTFHNRLT